MDIPRPRVRVAGSRSQKLISDDLIRKPAYVDDALLSGILGLAHPLARGVALVLAHDLDLILSWSCIHYHSYNA